ncbi:type I/III endonuclease restriction R subunit [Acetobacter tropicalis NRIC 0312]|uniref:Type I restriction enzyme endonuclease subunit n=3 Tax=Acetobacter tropicalis TaxID=104102 RepID=A0A511FS59_9PROT|nr:HsdR family type I site-specific deoxyribonuclease [Acetobacter tropicalis]KXV51105.1 DEAD/DEAH box helicase [Acetobacter tropicalis]GBR70807.1 type I/III endonuclease restriction R subunit [Acetobacter tropicalis NRIC 0312]GEL51786.1 DEAD/DEAH box helicase [Acetobacter tropicalis]
MVSAPKFQEEYSAKLPALALLSTLGWRFLSPSEPLALRGGKQNAVVLAPLLRAELKKRRFTFEGQEHSLSDQAIERLVSIVTHPDFVSGLRDANDKMTTHLLFGIAITEFINGHKANPTIALIDWQNPENNSFTFTEEFSVLRNDLTQTRRPDIVCFVNGIPLAVIEAKRPDGQPSKGPTVEAGISQSIRNQNKDEIPQLFAYSQLLLSITGHDGRYGTCGTPKKFWASWKEEDIPESQMEALKNTPLSSAQKDALFADRKASDRAWFEDWASRPLHVTDQDRLLIGLLSPERLLEMARFFTLVDRKAGKIVARYQQVFGIKRLLERIKSRRSDGGREGGVVWHTTGSGKSFTMVFLSRALILDDDLKQCRILVVTDRKDLERQLSTTFSTGGELADKKDKEEALATSGRRLAQQIGHGQERIIFSLINKFHTATTLPECHNDSADIIVLVDEGHRSQGGENHARMKHALPNAAFIAFTGTPLLKGSETTSRFGRIIHSYTMQQAVSDGTVTPLLYEERKPDLDVNDRAIDAWFERITQGLNEEQVTDLKKRFARANQVYKADDRIRLIAMDLATHFDNNIDKDLKGMLACDSKLSAIRYKQYLDEVGLFESAIVMSPPDTREGHTEVDERRQPEIHAWWKENVGSQSEDDYTRGVIERFENDPDLRLIIVVDKLLTGFDEPKNAVLYIDKPLKQHNLLQAIARVNRLHDQKKHGLLIDYRGILAELDTTLARYDELAAENVGGYDPKDIAGLYSQMSTEYRELPALHKALWVIFDGVKNRSDLQQLRAVLMPRMVEEHGQMVDVNLKRRDDFYEALTKFAACLKVALQSVAFFEDTSFTEKDRATYKETLKQLTSLRQMVMQDTGETVDFDQYAEQVKKLLDRHVAGVKVHESGGLYAVGKMGQKPEDNDPENWTEEKTRNETDLIRTRVTKMIDHEMQDDPYAKEAFSALLRKVIEEAESLFDHPLKNFMLFQEFEEQVTNRRLENIPSVFDGHRHAQAYYGVFLKTLAAIFNHKQTDEEKQRWIDLAFEIDRIVDKAVRENSLSRPDMEKAVRQQLLGLLHNVGKQVGFGTDKALDIVEQVVQIMRAGPADPLRG